jgi:hypothetical protein
MIRPALSTRGSPFALIHREREESMTSDARAPGAA